MSASPQSQLLRVLGLAFSVAVVVGGIVGSGILRAPGLIAQGFPDPWLMLAVWALGGVFVALDAMPTVELGAAIPNAGGPYALAMRAFGPLIGFLAGWADWLQNAASTGFIAVVFAEFVHRLGLASAWPTGLIAALLVAACGVINWIGTRTSGASQTLGSGLKGIGLIVLIALLWIAPRGTAPPPSAPPPAMSWALAVAALRALYSTFGGWHAPVYFSEEISEPHRNLARAVFGGIGLVTLVYLGVNAALLHVLPIQAIAGSKLAVADAARVAIGPAADTLVTVVSIVSVATICNLQVMAQTRITYAMARDGLFPPGLARVAKGGTPRLSLLLTLVFCLAFAGTGIYALLLAIYTPLAMVTFLLLGWGAIRLRRREPELPRPWRMPLYPLPVILSLAANFALLVATVVEDPAHSAWSLVLLVLPLPLYAYGARRWRGSGLKQAL